MSNLFRQRNLTPELLSIRNFVYGITTQRTRAEFTWEISRKQSVCRPNGAQKRKGFSETDLPFPTVYCCSKSVMFMWTMPLFSTIRLSQCVTLPLPGPPAFAQTKTFGHSRLGRHRSLVVSSTGRTHSSRRYRVAFTV